MRHAAVLTAILLLAGCSTTSPQQRMASHQTSCSGYGFQPGTDAYANCLMQMDAIANEQDANRREALATALGKLGQSMQTRRPTTCNTTGRAYGIGNQAFGNSTTTCY